MSVLRGVGNGTSQERIKINNESLSGNGWHVLSCFLPIRIEETWRLWQKFLDDYSRFEDWLKSAERTAACPNSSEVLYTNAKEELKRFEVKTPCSPVLLITTPAAGSGAARWLPLSGRPPSPLPRAQSTTCHQLLRQLCSALPIYANWQAVNWKACSLADVRGTDEVSPQSPFQLGN